MKTAAERIADYVMGKSGGETLGVRSALYRDLAALTADDVRAQALTALADDLDAIERRTNQLRFDLGEADLPTAEESRNQLSAFPHP